MPKISSKNRELSRVEYIESVWRDFDDPTKWKRSKNGNLWRHFEGLTLSVFRRDGDDFFGWCIAGTDGKRFSPGAFETEGEAMQELGGELELGVE